MNCIISLKKIACSCFALGAGSLALPAADVDLSQLDLDPFVVGYIKNVSVFQEKLESSELGKLGITDVWPNLYKEILTSLRIEIDQPISQFEEFWDVLADGVKGQVLLAVTAGKSEEGGMLPFVSVLFEYDGDIDQFEDHVVRFFSSEETPAVVLKSYFSGLEVKEIELETSSTSDSLYYASEGGVIMMTSSMEALEDAILQTRASRDGKANNSTSLLERTSTGQERYIMEFAVSMDRIFSAMRETTPDSLMIPELLGIDSIEHIFWGMDVKEAAIHGELYASFHERRGVGSFLNHMQPLGSFPSYFPLSASAAEVGAIDISGVLNEIESMALQAFPQARDQYTRYLEMIRSTTGVDVRGGILNNFGVGYRSISGYPPELAESERQIEDMSNVYILNLIDPQGFRLAIDALKQVVLAGFELFEPRDYLNETIYRMQDGGVGNMGFSYAIVNDKLVLGSGYHSFTESVIARVKRSDAGLWQDGAIQPLLRQVPDNTSVIQLLDFPTVFGLFVEGMLQELSVDASEIEGWEELSDKLKNSGLKLFSYTLSEGNRLESHFRLQKVEQ